MTRREAMRWPSAASMGARFAFAQADVSPASPALARGAPTSPERLALIEAFRQRSEGLERTFQARVHKGDSAIDTPLWGFHGDADQTVTVSVSRDRIAARRKAGGHPIYTEYAGVDHNCWQWAYTEPGMIAWLFAQRRRN